MSKAVVLLSGGIDSTVVLALAKHVSSEVYILFFDYAQPQIDRESQAVQKILKHYGMSHNTHGSRIELPLREFSLSGKAWPEAFIPFRNGTFISIATAWAESNAFDEVWTGMYNYPIRSRAFPDQTPEFLGAMRAAVHIGTAGRVRLVCPLEEMSKKAVIQLAVKYGVPLDFSWTCYHPLLLGTIPCGVCDACLKRRKAFTLAGIEDPLRYPEQNRS